MSDALTVPACALLGAEVQGLGAHGEVQRGHVVRVWGRWTVLVKWESGHTAPASLYGVSEIEGSDEP